MKISMNFILAVVIAILMINFISSVKHKKNRSFHKAAVKTHHKSHDRSHFKNHHMTLTHHKSNLKSKSKSKSKSRAKGYDPTYSPQIIGDLIKQHLINNDYLKKDEDSKLMTECLTLFSEENTHQREKSDFWKTMENFAINDKVKMKRDIFRKFIISLNSIAYIDGNANQKIDCGEKTAEFLKEEKDLKYDEIKEFFRSQSGAYELNLKKNRDTLITSFASYYRDSDLRNPQMFKKLNARNRGA